MTEKKSGLSNSNYAIALTTGISLYILLTFCLLSAMPATLPAVIYPLDDTYIYMAMARNIADHGIWGVTAYGFSGTSSSHLWIIFLAFFYKLFGSVEIIPLLLNILFGILCFGAIALVARQFNYSFRQLIFITLSFLFLVYPSQLTTIGMETVLLCLLTLMFAWSSFKLIDLKDSVSASPKLLTATGIITALFCACRYESVYVVAPVILIMLLRKRLKECMVLIIGVLFPIVSYGVYSMAHGNLFFPNTILLKGRVGFTDPIHGILTQQVDLGRTALKQLWLIGSMLLYLALRARDSISLWGKRIYFAIYGLLALSTVFGVLHSLKFQRLFGLTNSFTLLDDISCEIIFLTVLGTAAIALIHLIRSCSNKEEAKPQSLLLDTTILAIVAHMLTARFGWLFRYEAYLLTMASIVYVPNLVKYYTKDKTNPCNWKTVMSKSHLPVAYALIVLSFGLFIRTALATAVTAIHATGVRYQHIEAAYLVRDNFSKGNIVANDIGALCYFAKDIRLLDLWGLADLKVAQARGQHRLNTAFIEQYTTKYHGDIAVIQEPFLEGTPVPDNWIKAGYWHTPPAYNDIDELSFYSINPDSKTKLEHALEEHILPKQIQFRRAEQAITEPETKHRTEPTAGPGTEHRTEPKIEKNET